MAHHGCAVPPPPPPPLRPPPPLPPPPPAFRKLGANLSTRKSTRSKNSMFRALGTCFCISSQRRFDCGRATGRCKHCMLQHIGCGCASRWAGCGQ
eukprot:362425-Chlamydomonas_euryale.AAC.2